MPGSFQTGTDSIHLDGPPWNVTATVKLFVLLRLDGTIGLFHNEGCTHDFEPAEMVVSENVSTGLYFHIAADSPAGTLFCDGLDHRPPPVKWLASEGCPQTVTYGKIRKDRLAFSMSDLAAPHPATVRLPFDLMIETPDGVITSILKSRRGIQPGIVPVDPTIVEKGEEPPGGGG